MDLNYKIGIILMNIARYAYIIVGHIWAFILEIVWTVRDFFIPIESSALLIVAHPDDDILFFHQFLEEYKPYVICVSMGGRIKRIVPFYKAMKQYGVRYRCYDMKSKPYGNELLLCNRIQNVISKGKFTICATHNSSGEYGHEMHKYVHRCVRRVWKGNLFVPVSKEEIEQYPLPDEVYNKKDSLLRLYYYNEYPTLEGFNVWIRNEKLIEDNIENIRQIQGLNKQKLKIY